MEKSYNGWTASTAAKDFGGLDNRVVGGVKLAPGVRAGDVSTVLFYVAEQFHNRVERLVSPGCWGFSYRQNRNAANLSCHSSATAIDLNAPRHPNGKRGTFSKPQVAAIRQILAEVGGVVRWGGDFTGTPDEMHFEIVAAPATVAMIAARLTGRGMTSSPVTILPVSPPVQEDDMYGDPDRQRDADIQNKLNEVLSRVQGISFPAQDGRYVPMDSARLVQLYDKFVNGGQVSARDVAAALLPELTVQVQAAVRAAGTGGDPKAIATAVLDGLAARVAA